MSPRNPGSSTGPVESCYALASSIAKPHPYLDQRNLTRLRIACMQTCLRWPLTLHPVLTPKEDSVLPQLPWMADLRHSHKMLSRTWNANAEYHRRFVSSAVPLSDLCVSALSKTGDILGEVISADPGFHYLVTCSNDTPYSPKT